MQNNFIYSSLNPWSIFNLLNINSILREKKTILALILNLLHNSGME